MDFKTDVFVIIMIFYLQDQAVQELFLGCLTFEIVTHFQVEDTMVLKSPNNYLPVDMT